MFSNVRKLIIILNVAFFASATNDSNRSFLIDYENDRFLKDGKAHRFISGSVHYFRVPSYYWQDRLIKLKSAGLNAVETYVAWNVHQPNGESEFSFAGNANLFRFLRLAQHLELDVILRMGPYICAEFEFGGIPWWLLKTAPDIQLRTSDSRFLLAVSKWYGKLLPTLSPYLHKNGGPVIAMQIENEYGSRHLCDANYTRFLSSLFRRYVGDDFVLFTTDGASVDHLTCGHIQDAYPTVDFGAVLNRSEVEQYFVAQRQFAPRGPLVNSEFYTGWLDLWGTVHSVVDTEVVVETMTWMHNMNASYNFYVFHGGSNFGYTNGASWTNQPSTQSYDYDAPLNEAGDLTEKYFAIKNRLEMLTGVRSNGPAVFNTKKFAYGDVTFERLAPLTSLLDVLCPKKRRRRSRRPQSFEELDFGHGYVLYETNLNIVGNSTANLNIQQVSDRAYVMINGRLIGTTSKRYNEKFAVHHRATGVGLLQILVENMGRQNMGPADRKGILGNVIFNDTLLTNWTHYPLTLENVFPHLHNPQWRRDARKAVLKNGRFCSKNFSPSIYYSIFRIANRQDVGDTYFNPTDWSKGQFLLNGINVGRYWPKLGPQVTLFVPKPYVKTENFALLLELEMPGNCERSLFNFCNASFDDFPQLDKPVEPNNMFSIRNGETNL